MLLLRVSRSSSFTYVHPRFFLADSFCILSLHLKCYFLSRSSMQYQIDGSKKSLLLLSFKSCFILLICKAAQTL